MYINNEDRRKWNTLKILLKDYEEKLTDLLMKKLSNSQWNLIKEN